MVSTTLEGGHHVREERRCCGRAGYEAGIERTAHIQRRSQASFSLTFATGAVLGDFCGRRAAKFLSGQGSEFPEVAGTDLGSGAVVCQLGTLMAHVPEVPPSVQRRQRTPLLEYCGEAAYLG